MARRSRTSMVLAGLSLAGLGLLAPMGSASAAAPPSSPQQAESIVSGQQAPSAAVNCWTTVEQPGGNGTTITVYYRNCGNTTARVTPNSHAIAFDGSFTYVARCQSVPPGYVGIWPTTPSLFPPVETNRWGVTICL
ncbi:hypothetical protein [Nonomuraea longicatena]|uniref:Secreted protein n=1 Tax=Nonomuraea longicatena TaxID=83682 RepID=A0ABN1Q3B9_9ACTN